MNGDETNIDAETAPEPRRVSAWPRRRLTVEALGLILIFTLVVLAFVFVFVLIRNSDDPEVHASGVEGILSLGAVLVGAMAGYMGRSALGGAVPVRAAPPPETDE